MLKRMLVVAAALAVVVAPAAVQAGSHKDIVDTAVAAGSFKTLATALQAAGLVDTLKGPGPFTVFAPTDEAFAKIPKADLDALIADKAKLTKVLTYHVVPGKVMAADVVKLKEAKTVEGQMVQDRRVERREDQRRQRGQGRRRGLERRHPRHRLRDPAAVAPADEPCARSRGVRPGGARSSALDVVARFWRSLR